jgi:hypothetical protein
LRDAANGDRKSTGSNLGCTLRCEFFPHSFSQSSSDVTITSTFAKASAGQVGVFRAGMMHHLGIVPQRLLCEPFGIKGWYGQSLPRDFAGGVSETAQ